MRLRLLTAATLGIASGLLCWLFLHHFHQNAGDFTWAVNAARDLLSARDPYAGTPPGAVPYPMPAVLLAIPFAWLPRETAGAAFFGLSSALLAFGLTRLGYRYLLIFLVYPYWAALITAQWTPLITAAAFFPPLLAVTLAKPQVGLPVAIHRYSHVGLIAALGLLVISFLVMPRWFSAWLPQLKGYQHFFPILVLPGPILLLALWRFRDADARFLVLASIFPERWFYDALILWLIPKSRRELLATMLCSWLLGIWRWHHIPQGFSQAGRWMVLAFYLPMLAVVLLRAKTSPEK
jgi:hypothetical protein